MAIGRLKMVLSTDRVEGTAGMLEMMKNDILDVMRRYVIINEQDIDIQLRHQGPNGEAAHSKLMVDIPLKNIKRVK